MRLFRALCLVLTLAPGLLAAQENPAWQPLGPWGGTVSAIAIHPTDPQLLYAGGNLTGVVKSTDAGASWRLLPGSPSFPAFVALDPGRPTTVYASQYSARQIFKSTDGGTHWRLINVGLPADLDVSGLAVDPARPSRLYLGSARKGVWRSLDGGASWQRASRGLPLGGNVQVLSLAVPRRPAGTAFINTIYGLFRTRNAGASWHPLLNGLPANQQIYALALAPSDPRTLYVSTANRVYRSEDGGDSWAPGGQPPGGTAAAIAVHPRLPRTLYGGTGFGIFKSTDGGRSWEPTEAPTNVSVTVMALDSSRKGIVYAGLALRGDHPGGVLRSADGGETWERRNRGLPGQYANSVAADPADPDALAAALDTGGLFRSSNGGVRFARTGAGFPPTPAYTVLMGQALASGPGTFYALEFRPSRLWRSTDSGLTWRQLPGPEGEVFFLRADPLDPATLYAISLVGFDWRIHRSGDGGLSWTPLAPPPPNCGLADLAVARPSASSPAVLYLAGSQSASSFCGVTRSALFRSTDGGASWTGADAGLPGELVLAVAVDPQDSRAVYAGIGPGTLQGVERGVWKSTDSGATWQASGLQQSSILALAASPVPGVLWASAPEGFVYRSGDAGATWQDQSGGLVLRDVRDFAFDPADPEHVYIAGFGGVWVIGGVDR